MTTYDIASQTDSGPSKAQRLTGAQALVAGLESAGIEVVFGLCGHTNVAMLHAIEESSLRFVGVRHEQVASHAADGYFRASRRPAAVLTTIGPGLTNALTGIGDAALDGAAMVVIAGDVPSYLTGRDGFQELALHGDAQQIDVARPLVKRAWRVSRREVLVHDLARAVNVAVSGRPGPVLLDVPMDYFSEPLVEVIPHLPDCRAGFDRPHASAEAIAVAGEMLRSSSAAVIYAGGGAAGSGARDEVTALAEHLGLPVVTTMSGHGVIDRSHPLAAGYTATVGTPFAHALVNGADTILVLGSQLAEMETSSYRDDVAFRVPPTRLIQVDIDPTQIGKNYPVEVGVVADVKAFTGQLLAWARAEVPPTGGEYSPRIQELRDQRAAWDADIRAQSTSDAVPIVVERLLADIRAALPADGIFLTDVGIRHQVAQQFPVADPERFYLGSGWGTMGGAVGAALGAKLARPDVPVVAEVGDGAFGSVLSAVITAVEFQIGVVWVVMNNQGYSSISVYQAKHGMGTLGTSFATPDGEPYNPDFAAVAVACGALGRRITDPADLRPALEEAIASGQPYVLDVQTERAPRTRASGYWDVNDVLNGANFLPPADER